MTHEWTNELDFRTLLKDVTRNATNDRLQLLAEMAEQDAPVAYKHIVALLLKDLKRLKPDYRIRIIFAMSSIVRTSVSRNGNRDKYVPRLTQHLGFIADCMADTSEQHQQQFARVLSLWWREGVFQAADVAKLQRRFPIHASATTSRPSSDTLVKQSSIQSGCGSGSAARGGEEEGQLEMNPVDNNKPNLKTTDDDYYKGEKRGLEDKACGGQDQHRDKAPRLHYIDESSRGDEHVVKDGGVDIDEKQKEEKI